MRIGMLWYDDSDKKLDFPARIKRAVVYYESKYGESPDVCYINPAALAGLNGAPVAGILLLPARTVLPNHFWLGREKADSIPSQPGPGPEAAPPAVPGPTTAPNALGAGPGPAGAAVGPELPFGQLELLAD